MLYDLPSAIAEIRRLLFCELQIHVMLCVDYDVFNDFLITFVGRNKVFLSCFFLLPASV